MSLEKWSLIAAITGGVAIVISVLQAQSGVLDRDIWNTYARVICFDLADSGRPGIKATWPDHASVLDPEFVAVIERCPGFA